MKVPIWSPKVSFNLDFWMELTFRVDDKGTDKQLQKEDKVDSVS